MEVARTSGMHILSFRGQLQGLCSGNVHLWFMTRLRPSRHARALAVDMHSYGCRVSPWGHTTAHAVEAEDGNQVDGKHVHNWRLILSICILVGVKHGLGRSFSH